MQGLIGLSKNKFFQTLLNRSNLAYFLIGLKTFKMSPNGVNMAGFFPKKIARIAQRFEALPLGPHKCHMFKISKTFRMSSKGVKMAVFFPKKIRRIAQRLEASPPGPHTCHHVQNIKKVQNVIQIALKWLFIFFRKKIAKIAQQLEASPPGYHTCHHVQNVKNVQNIIQIALKCLFFSEKIEELPSGWELRLYSGSFFSRTQSSQPSTLKIVITGFLNKQML